MSNEPISFNETEMDMIINKYKETIVTLSSKYKNRNFKLGIFKVLVQLLILAVIIVSIVIEFKLQSNGIRFGLALMFIGIEFILSMVAIVLQSFMVSHEVEQYLVKIYNQMVRYKRYMGTEIYDNYVLKWCNSELDQICTLTVPQMRGKVCSV